MDRQDWNKFVKVFNLDVNVTVKKEITKSDVILSLLDEGQLAFRGYKGNQMVFTINDKMDLKLLEEFLFKPMKEYLKEKKQTSQKDDKTNQKEVDNK